MGSTAFHLGERQCLAHSSEKSRTALDTSRRRELNPMGSPSARGRRLGPKSMMPCTPN